MAVWAAMRRARGLDPPQPKSQCRNCGKAIAEGHAYCFWCAIFGGQRRIK